MAHESSHALFAQSQHQHDYPRESCLHALFEQRAQETPKAVAARHRGREIKYSELDNLGNCIALRLREAGVRTGSNVGVFGGRSLETLAAILGVLKAGATYVPLDPSYPARHLQMLATTAEISVVITLPGLACPVRKLQAKLAWEDISFSRRAAPEVTSDATQAACIMFTSGSAGKPKAVAIPHRGIVRLVTNTNYIEFSSRDRVLHAAHVSFDASNFEIWGALLHGATLVLADNEIVLAPSSLELLLQQEAVSVAFLTTSLLHHVARSRPQALSGLRCLVTGGETLLPDLAREILVHSRPGQLINGYGPTENSTFSCAYRVRDVAVGTKSLPIGQAISNASCFILRGHSELAQIGEEGELYVGGDGLALGYLGDSELTASCFQDHTFSGSPVRLYRTGDRARMNESGLIEFCGRIDRQFKVRGFRVELGEVEAALRLHPDVSVAVVEAVHEDDGVYRLRAYVVPKSQALSAGVLRRYLSHTLPAHMVPANIVTLEALPLGPTGKVDTQALRALSEETSHIPTATQYQTPLEARIADLWKRSLGTSHVEGSDDFFALGGDSLRAAQVLLQLGLELGFTARASSLLLHNLLQFPTLSRFASAVEEVVQGKNVVSPAQAVDFEAESQATFSFAPRVDPAPNFLKPRAIFLTGASGFLGAFLLHRLLTTTDARVFCPVRARSRADALTRVRMNLSRYGLSAAWDERRVEAMPGDLEQDLLGLSPSEHAALEDSLDLILHNGTLVNFLYPYSKLKAANVGGTRRIIALAQKRRVPVHYVSTIATLSGFGAIGQRHVTEDTALAYPEQICMGYPQSKWVAEVILQKAAKAGLPVSIYRPYEITGAQRTGVWNTETAIPAMFKMIVESGVAPDVDLPLDFVPVDYLANAIVHIATRRADSGKVYHLTNPRPTLLGSMTERLRRAGYPIRKASYAEWLNVLVDFAGKYPAHPFSPFVPIFLDPSANPKLTIKEMYFAQTFPEITRDNRDEALKDTGLICPPVDNALLDLYIRHLRASGFLQTSPDLSPAHHP